MGGMPGRIARKPRPPNTPACLPHRAYPADPHRSTCSGQRGYQPLILAMTPDLDHQRLLCTGLGTVPAWFAEVAEEVAEFEAQRLVLADDVVVGASLDDPPGTVGEVAQAGAGLGGDR
jgi:hypothetical protein